MSYPHLKRLMQVCEMPIEIHPIKKTQFFFSYSFWTFDRISLVGFQQSGDSLGNDSGIDCPQVADVELLNWTIS